jgi:hypothetical protein
MGKHCLFISLSLRHKGISIITSKIISLNIIGKRDYIFAVMLLKNVDTPPRPPIFLYVPYCLGKTGFPVDVGHIFVTFFSFETHYIDSGLRGLV